LWKKIHADLEEKGKIGSGGADSMYSGPKQRGRGDERTVRVYSSEVSIGITELRIRGLNRERKSVKSFHDFLGSVITPNRGRERCTRPKVIA